MSIVFHAIQEDRPGPKWRGVFDRRWHGYSRWFLREGIRSRPTYLKSVGAVKTHLPELLPAYERLVEAAGGGDLEARFLSMWCPPAYVGGCSQAIVGSAPPALMRNYDYSPVLFEGTWLASRYLDTATVAVIDCLWGALDGINEHGLAASLSFGGRPAAGKGFGIPIVLRYVLELARDVSDAIAILQRVPVHMSYTVALLDRQGGHATVFVNPGRKAEVAPQRISTNHQHRVEWQRHAEVTHSVERERILRDALKSEPEAEDALSAFLRPPVYQTNFLRGYGTLYTAIYDPLARSAELVWPDFRWRQAIGSFKEGSHTANFMDTGRHPAPLKNLVISKGAL